MITPLVARLWFALTALVVLVGIDVGDHGYPRVLLNCAVVAALVLLLAAGAHLLDARLPRR